MHGLKHTDRAFHAVHGSQQIDIYDVQDLLPFIILKASDRSLYPRIIDYCVKISRKLLKYIFVKLVQILSN